MTAPANMSHVCKFIMLRILILLEIRKRAYTNRLVLSFCVFYLGYPNSLRYFITSALPPFFTSYFFFIFSFLIIPHFAACRLKQSRLFFDFYLEFPKSLIFFIPPPLLPYSLPILSLLFHL